MFNGRARPPLKSKAAPSTQCQKCYEYGHYTYECTNPRVYKSRPSRTKQLRNPKLIIKPTHDLPDEFLSKKKLAEKIEKELNEQKLLEAKSTFKSRSRSISTTSSISSRSISSPSPSPERHLSKTVSPHRPSRPRHSRSRSPIPREARSRTKYSRSRSPKSPHQ